MPAQISLDFEKIEQVSKQLDSANETIVPMLNDLKNSVNDLLQDGLVFQQSSPALRESYEKFNSSLIAAMEGIKNFANQFRGIRDSMQDIDTNMASEIRKSG